MSILPKAICRFSAVPIRLPTVFFRELEQIISQFVWKYKKTSNSQSTLEKRLKLEESTYLASDCIATVIKTVWYWHKDKCISMEQNRKPRDKPMHL